VRKLITLREALRDPELLGSEFRGASWLGWRAIMLASVGEELDSKSTRRSPSLPGPQV
jgi:hypothetical protein